MLCESVRIGGQLFRTVKLWCQIRIAIDFLSRLVGARDRSASSSRDSQEDAKVGGGGRIVRRLAHSGLNHTRLDGGT
jgi:hypothetical protein